MIRKRPSDERNLESTVSRGSTPRRYSASGGASGACCPYREVEAMNHLLSGTAFAAALAIAAPVWAQTPTTPNPAGAPSTTTAAPYTQSAPPATSQTAPYAQQAPTRPMAPSATAPAPYSTTENATEPMRRAHHGRYAGHMRMHRMRHAPSASRGSRAPNDNIANQLNSQELGRVSGNSAPPAGYSPQGNPQQGQPQGYPQQGQPPSGPRY